MEKLVLFVYPYPAIPEVLLTLLFFKLDEKKKSFTV